MFEENHSGYNKFSAADRRAQFEKLEYTEEDYQKELEHIEQVKLLIFQYTGTPKLFLVTEWTARSALHAKYASKTSSCNM